MSDYKCPEPGCDYHVGFAGQCVTDEDFEQQDYYFEEIEQHIQSHEGERSSGRSNEDSWERCFSGVRLAPGVCVREYASPIVRRFGFPRVAEECANNCHNVLLNRLKQVKNSLRFGHSGYVNSLYACGFEFHLHVVLSSAAGDLGGGHYCARLTPDIVGDEVGDGRTRKTANLVGAADKASGVGEPSVLVEVAQVSKGLQREVVPIGVGFKMKDLRPFEVCQELWGNHFAQILGISSKVGGRIRDGERNVFESRISGADLVNASNVLTNDMVQGGAVAVDRVSDHERPVAIRQSGVHDFPLSLVSAFLKGIRFEVDDRSCGVKFVEGFNRFYESCSVVIAPQELSSSTECSSTVIHDQQFSLSVGDASVDAVGGSSESTERDHAPESPDMKEPSAVAAAEGDETNNPER